MTGDVHAFHAVRVHEVVLAVADVDEVKLRHQVSRVGRQGKTDSRFLGPSGAQELARRGLVLDGNEWAQTISSSGSGSGNRIVEKEHVSPHGHV